VRGNGLHQAALESYLQRGGNLIDTSANYGDGAAEELVGQLPSSPDQNVILVTKGGYIQGQNMLLAAQQRNFSEVVEYGPGIWHSIHPDFLQTQIELSLARLRREHVDIYLLHNPEYYLEDISHRRAVTAEDHNEFYRRIRQAFAFLEAQVALGKIRWYGISSNNFGGPGFSRGSPTAGSSTGTSVSRSLAEAEALSADHHFRIVQLPVNLYEPGGALEPNNHGRTVLDFCREKGLGVLANRPLNAFVQNQLVRLADWGLPGVTPPEIEEFRRRLEPLERHEQVLEREFGQPLALHGGDRVSSLLLRLVPQWQSISHFEHQAGSRFVGPLRAWLEQTGERHKGHPGWPAWRDQFIEIVQELLEEVHSGGHAPSRVRGRCDEHGGAR
jgi:aryl-alcohol dehydrogenase-like predicted oxidoreductase